MSTTTCAGCGVIVEVAPELMDDDDIPFEPYFCDACDRLGRAAADEGPDPATYCPHCGKDYEDWSDLGCEFCDTRVFIKGL